MFKKSELRNGVLRTQTFLKRSAFFKNTFQSIKIRLTVNHRSWIFIKYLILKAECYFNTNH